MRVDEKIGRLDWCKDCNITMRQEKEQERDTVRLWLECERFRKEIGLGVGFRCWHPEGTIFVRDHEEVEEVWR
jgi:hypothetical protein